VGLAVVLLLLLLLLPLSGFLAGVLPGGGRRESEPAPSELRVPGTLRVLVRRPAGAPVEGARITVNGLEASASDARGEVTLAKLPGPVLVEASFEGRRARAWVDPDVTDTVRLEPAPEPVRTGRAPDGATVLLLDRDGRELARDDVEDGRYELPDEPGAVAVCVQVEGAAPISVRDGDAFPPDDDDDDDAVAVEGRVAGLFGPFEIFGELMGANADVRLPFRARARANADGRYAVKLPRDARAFGVTPDGQPFPLGVDAGAPPPMVELGGRVQTALGSPVHAAVLELYPLDSDGRPTPLPPVRLRADEDAGTFALDRFPAVRCRVRVEGRDCATRIFEDVDPGPDLAFTLDAGYAVKGRVVDPAGRPVPSAVIKAEGLPAGDGRRPLLEDRADAEGRFLVRGLGGRYARIRVEAEDHVPTTITRVDKNARLRVVLLPR